MNSGKLQFKFDSILKRNVGLPRRPDKRARGKLASIDLEMLFRNIKKKRLGGGYFGFNEPRARTSTEGKNVSSKMCRAREKVTRCWQRYTYFLWISKNTILYKKNSISNQIKYLNKKPMLNSVEAKENLQKAKLSFMVDLKTLTHKNFGWLETAIFEDMFAKQSTGKNRRISFSVFQWTHGTLRFVNCGQQNDYHRRIKKAGGWSAMLRTSVFVENVGWEQIFLMVGDEEAYWKQVSYMHCMHEFRWECKVPVNVDRRVKLPVLAEPGHNIQIKISELISIVNGP